MSPELRDEIVQNVEYWAKRTGTSLNKILAGIGLRKPRFYDWKERIGKPNQHNGNMPRETWILPEERTTIIDYYLKNPGVGCKRLAYMMIDEDVAYVSHNTVYRVLKAEGLLEPHSVQPSLKGQGFKQPHAPHEEWHIDISYINAGGTFYYLCSVMDGYSRFIVDWEIRESMRQEDCQVIVQRAKEKIGCGKKVRLISDNGPQFKSKQFKSFLKYCGMDQIFTSPYYPQSNGKIERWHRELKLRCIRVRNPRNLKEAREYVGNFIEQYNYGRLHSGIGYVTPYDKLLGLDAELHRERHRKLLAGRSRRRVVWANRNSSQYAASA